MFTRLRGAIGIAVLMLACARMPDDGRALLQGTWVATSAERDGAAAEDVLGNRLTFSVDRFEIESKDGVRLYAGTFRVDTERSPAAIDFTHTEGTLNGRTWLGIYAVDGDRLTICDNAPNLDASRPTAFETQTGSEYVMITFRRASFRS